MAACELRQWTEGDRKRHGRDRERSGMGETVWVLRMGDSVLSSEFFKEKLREVLGFVWGTQRADDGKGERRNFIKIEIWDWYVFRGKVNREKY